MTRLRVDRGEGSPHTDPLSIADTRSGRPFAITDSRYFLLAALVHIPWVIVSGREAKLEMQGLAWMGWRGWGGVDGVAWMGLVTLEMLE